MNQLIQKELPGETANAINAVRRALIRVHTAERTAAPFIAEVADARTELESAKRSLRTLLTHVVRYESEGCIYEIDPTGVITRLQLFRL